MCGSPGSGKSTLSKQIANEQNLVRLSLDEMGYIRQHKLIPHVVDALQYLVGRIKNECVIETELN